MAEPESLAPQMMDRLDKMLSDALVKFGIVEGEKDIVCQCGSVRLRIFEAGDYVRKDDPTKKVTFEAGVELRQGGIVLHVEPSDLALLCHNMKYVSAVNEELSKRLDVEKKLMKSIGF